MVVLSLALGIGANTALFSAINGLLPSETASQGSGHARAVEMGRPQRHGDELERLRIATRRPRCSIRATVSCPMYQQFLEDNRTMEDLFACAPYGRGEHRRRRPAPRSRTRSSRPETTIRCSVCTASPGRTIVPEDDRPAATPVAVISARYWRSRFGSDPRVVGKVVTFNNVPITIVGVIAPELVGVQQAFARRPRHRRAAGARCAAESAGHRRRRAHRSFPALSAANHCGGCR